MQSHKFSLIKGNVKKKKKTILNFSQTNMKGKFCRTLVKIAKREKKREIGWREFKLNNMVGKG